MLGDQPRQNLKLASKDTTRVVDSQSFHRDFAYGSSRQNNAGFAIQCKMQMPSQQPRLVIARIEEMPHLPGLVFAGDSITLCQVAARTTEYQVTQQRLPAARERQVKVVGPSKLNALLALLQPAGMIGVDNGVLGRAGARPFAPRTA